MYYFRLSKLSVSMLIIVLLLMVFTTPASATTESQSVYTFSDFDAKSVVSPSKAIEAMQLPTEYINVTTKDLIKSVSQYPYLVNILAFNSYEEGFKDLCERFNGMKELVQRPDAHQEILEYLKSQPKDGDRTLKEKLAIDVFQIVLAQKEITPAFSERDIANIVQIVKQISAPGEWTFFEFALDERQRSEGSHYGVSSYTNGTVWILNGTAVSVM